MRKNSVLLALLLLTLAALPAAAQSTDAEVLRCAAQPDGTARLACFDALATRLRALPVSAPSALPPAAVTPEQKVAAFGAPQISAKDELDAMQSRIDGLFEGWQGGSIFTLANGQRWMVMDGSSGVVSLKNPKVTVRRGALGSFRIEFEGSNQTARVRRL
jgi:hypothetical protein